MTDFSARRRCHHGDLYETGVYRRHLDGVAEEERRHAYWEVFNAYYGGGVVSDYHRPFYAEFGGYGSSVPPFLWGPSPSTLVTAFSHLIRIGRLVRPMLFVN